MTFDMKYYFVQIDRIFNIIIQPILNKKISNKEMRFKHKSDLN